MAIHRLEELSWGELRRLGHEGALFLVPIGPMEDHGPHLPCGVDWFLAREFSQAIARRITYRDARREVVIAPGIPVGTSMMHQLGCLRVPMSTTRSLIEALGNELDNHGVRKAVVLTCHGAISHLAAIQSACSRVSARRRIDLYSPSHDMIARFLSGGYRASIERVLGRKFSDEEWKRLSSDFHAGAWETAFMLKFRPDLVKDFYRELPPHPWREGSLAMVSGLGTHRGYFGSPALASRELGEAAAQVLVDQSAALIQSFLEREPGVRPGRWTGAALLAGIGLLAGVGAALYGRSRRRSEAPAPAEPPGLTELAPNGARRARRPV
ncbi:MAG: creatininase family protein [Armatimonadetes bacterium]|nr:creatininase family protein [Armatimonadota bacterium]